MLELLTIKQASEWATSYLKKEVTTSNISYLIQYGKVSKMGENGNTLIPKEELLFYYKQNEQEQNLKNKLGEDLNWKLSFAEYKEAETTKHVHRLHPYKGKFIPQLVEYFIDEHVDKFKNQVFFKKGDILLDPFCGSGTTLVQASESGMYAIGVDVSSFNALIGNIKIGSYDLEDVKQALRKITKKLENFQKDKNNITFEKMLLQKLKIFNDKNFPNRNFGDFRYKKEKEQQFLKIYNSLVSEYGIELLQKNRKTFLAKWYLKVVREEIDFVFEELKKVKNQNTKKLLTVILSRTIRSCRATTHADLGTLKEPVFAPYYCRKHGKICKPIFSIITWWNRYCQDTVKRIMEFKNLRTDTFQGCFVGDSRNVDLYAEANKRNSKFAKLLKKKKIKGIFSSPPYVGLIDYHQQHAYAYDLYNFERRDDLEIGPLFKGQGKEAREQYVQGVSEVLNNCKKYLQDDYDVFLVANDKYNLYPKIAEKAGMKIVNQYKRPVLNRVEKDRGAYSEIVFHLKGDKSGVI